MTASADRLSAALGRSYRIERELGQGGMATVYLAEDLKHKRRVAVKVLKPELAARTGQYRSDIYGRRLTGTDTSVVPILTGASNETAISFSPDGRWLLYVTDETGRNEVYVRSFPDWNRLRSPVSVGGGEAPLWSRDGKEIFYLSASNQVMAVRFTGAATPIAGAPVALFTVPPDRRSYAIDGYTPLDVAADGRFLMARRVGSAGANAYPIVTENFLTVLRGVRPISGPTLPSAWTRE